MNTMFSALCGRLIDLLYRTFAFSNPDDYSIDIPEHHCGLFGDEYICKPDDLTILTIPCGTASPQSGVTFTYYVQENGTILALQSAEFLHFVPNWSDSGKHVCCRAHLSVAVPEVCYRLNITCE